MIRPRLHSVTNLSRNVARSQTFASSQLAQYGRTAAYRRLLSQAHSRERSSPLTSSILPPPSSPLRSNLQPDSVAHLSTLYHQTLSRAFHTSPPRFQQAQPKEDIRDPPRDDAEQQRTTEAENKSSDANKEQKNEEKSEESESESKSKDEKKEDAPPPPPHGDKTPWQVFTETLKNEFKASKEWNESTKQLASSAHQFTESEGVRKARAAYDATAGAATTKTAQALKSTASAIGTGAAWTWDSKVVQGVRGGVNAAGRGIEKATRPVRETKAFQNIKEVVDDGSSSRYGGWIEKEERRKRKEARDLKEGRRPIEKMEEDPKYVDSS
jgi:mitochondrial import inner membrane translocase subunit TIM44